MIIEYGKSVDFKIIAEKVQIFLRREGIAYYRFRPRDSYYDRLAVTFQQEFPLVRVPVRFRIQYDSSYGDDCYFSASIRIPRGIMDPSVFRCRKIALKYSDRPDMSASFESHSDGKYIGTFHVIKSVYGEHVTDADAMQEMMRQVRSVVAGIIGDLFEKGLETFVSGGCNEHSSAAKFEQLESMSEDDRLIVTDDDFEDPEETLDYTMLFESAGIIRQKEE